MLTRLQAYWDNLRSTLWFAPSVIVALAIALAWAALRLDAWVARTELANVAWAFNGGPESARQLLGTLAGSMITLTGVTFSITLAALALAAGQYSPRTLRNFMRDRFNQTVLGVFIGTFVFCVLLLRSIRMGDESYVPSVGVSIAILLALVSLGFFIFFIHHIASSIQVSSMIHGVSKETHHVIGKVFGHERAPVGPVWIRTAIAPVPDGFRVINTSDGYVERIDTETLCQIASEADLTLELLVGPGDFMTRDAPIAVTDRTPADPDTFTGRVLGAIFRGHRRTMAQDPSFGFRQLVDIAVRALSPGINDPTTACNAIDFLGGLLADIADRPWPAPLFPDADGTIRLRLRSTSFADYVSLSFTEIRRYGCGDIAVTLRLLDTIAVVAVTTGRGDRHAALWAEACAVVASAGNHMNIAGDRRRIDDGLRRVAQALNEDPDPHLLGRRAPA